MNKEAKLLSKKYESSEEMEAPSQLQWSLSNLCIYLNQYIIWNNMALTMIILLSICLRVNPSTFIVCLSIPSTKAPRNSIRSSLKKKKGNFKKCSMKVRWKATSWRRRGKHHLRQSNLQDLCIRMKASGRSPQIFERVRWKSLLKSIV